MIALLDLLLLGDVVGAALDLALCIFERFLRHDVYLLLEVPWLAHTGAAPPDL